MRSLANGEDPQILRANALVDKHTAAVADGESGRPSQLVPGADAGAAQLSSFNVPRVVLHIDEDDVPWLGTGKPDKRATRPLLEALTAQPVQSGAVVA